MSIFIFMYPSNTTKLLSHSWY